MRRATRRCSSSSPPTGEVPVEPGGAPPWDVALARAPFALVREGGRAFVELPTDALVAPVLHEDAELAITANVDACFRWTDALDRGFASGAFDVVPPATFEAIGQVWPNDYATTLASP
jgi:hypothetical protein